MHSVSSSVASLSAHSTWGLQIQLSLWKKSQSWSLYLTHGFMCASHTLTTRTSNRLGLSTPNRRPWNTTFRIYTCEGYLHEIMKPASKTKDLIKWGNRSKVMFRSEAKSLRSMKTSKPSRDLEATRRPNSNQSSSSSIAIVALGLLSTRW